MLRNIKCGAMAWRCPVSGLCFPVLCGYQKTRKRHDRFLVLSVFPGWLYIDGRIDGTVNLSMLLLKGFDIFPDENQNVAVDRASLIVGYKAKLFQHLFLYANGYTLDCHKITPIDILCVYFMAAMWYNVLNRYTVYLK